MEEKRAGTLLSGGRERSDNVFAFPVRNKKEVICPKCGDSTFKSRCPECGIPLKDAAYLKRVVPLFGKQLVRETKICGRCLEATTDDVCPLCGRDLSLI